jgi:hypothetical protein
MTKSPKIRILLLLLTAAFLLAQLVRPSKNIGNVDTPNDIRKVVNVPVPILNLLKTSCYDCHSNHTSYQWYHEVMPLGWWLNHHVEEGKAHFNFSEFASYSKKKQDHKLEELQEEVNAHEMPLESYELMHPEARLDAVQIREISTWAKNARSAIR